MPVSYTHLDVYKRQADTVAKAGGESLVSLRQKKDKGHAMAVMTKGAAEIAKKIYAEGDVYKRQAHGLVKRPIFDGLY